MPLLKTLQVQHFRNLGGATLHLGPAFNVFYGENASGKTSILEAIYLLSANRSFRTHKPHYLIQHDKDQLTVFGEFLGEDAHLDKVGISRNRAGEVQIRKNGANVHSSSELAQGFPCLTLDPESFNLFDGSPKARRAILDWLVFHVKPDFLNAWKNYARALKQRNMLLRRGKINRLELLPWDTLLCKEALKVEAMRQEVLVEFIELFENVLSAMSDEFDQNIELSYKTGWPAGTSLDSEKSLLTVLDGLWQRDLELGYSSSGSHRFDLKFQYCHRLASENLSRGQKKSVVIALHQAMAMLFVRRTGHTPAILLDDLPSELDSKRLTALCENLRSLGSQLFISAVAREQLATVLEELKDTPCSWFHVKQGQITVNNQ